MKEAKAQVKEDNCLGNDMLQNIYTADQNLRKKDLDARNKKQWPNNIVPTKYPGILRHFELSEGTYKMYLYTYQALRLLAAAAATGRLVANFDATGGLTDKPVEDILHAMLSFPPREVFTNAESHEQASRIYSSVTVAEYISNKHNGEEIGKFFRALDDACRLATGGKMDQVSGKVFGGTSGKPRLVRTDCDGASQNGMITAFRTEGQVTTRVMYHNVLLHALLHFDSQMKKHPDQAAQIAASLIKWLELIIPLFENFCNSHVFRALTDWLDDKERPLSIKNMKNKISPMFAHFANDITEDTSISASIAKLCSIIAIFNAQTIPCKFDLSSPTAEHRDEAKLLQVSLNQKHLVENAAHCLCIDNYIDMKNAVESEMKRNTTLSMQSFNGHVVASPTLDMIESEQVFYYVYLFSKDTTKKTGMLHIHIVYGNKAESEDDGADTSPLSVGWFEQEIPLPFDGTIPNPVHSPDVANYLNKEWLKCPAFWSRSIINLLRVGIGIYIGASNQYSRRKLQAQKGKERLISISVRTGTIYDPYVR